MGPQIAVPLEGDMSEWEWLRFTPKKTALHLYGRAQFGEGEMFNEDFKVAVYGVGLKVLVPLLGSEQSTFRLNGTVSAGPALMDTNFGEAFGFEPALGGSLDTFLSDGLSFTVGASYYAFITKDAVYEGPAFEAGLLLTF